MFLQAMILAAGRGERLLPLTRKTPKSLLEIGGKSLIVRQILRLRQAGFTKIIINVHHLGEQIMKALGDGHEYGVRIQYSVESQLLNTAGGIIKAQPYFNNLPFALVSADVVSDYNFELLAKRLHHWETCRKNTHTYDETIPLLHVVLHKNPEYHLDGDFLWDKITGALLEKSSTVFKEKKSLPTEIRSGTFIGIALFQPDLFASYSMNRPQSLLPVIQRAIAQKRATAEWHDGIYFDCGTAERLEAARQWQEKFDKMEAPPR